jgi:serine/threonine protein phosphatase PrpC
VTLVFRSQAISDIGLVRPGNEDSAITAPLLVAVADGMGGHAAGEIASKIAITTLLQLAPVLSDLAIDIDSREHLLLNITYEIDSEILAESKRNPEFAGMGTTLTALHLDQERVELLHIGDSRCYKYSAGKLEQLSYDHTVMQELLDQGRLTPDEVSSHPQRSILTQVLMGDSGLDPALMIYPVKRGDLFLLCSDGLSSVLSDLEIAKIIEASAPDQLLHNLLVATKAKGAPDNVTIIWSEVVEGSLDGTIELLGAAND